MDADSGRPAFDDADAPNSPYEQLKRAISEGEFPPRFPLVETTLAESFGVSRTPVREALTRLAQDGLVIRTDRGMVVRDRSPEEILDIYEVRILLAGVGARLAALRRTTLDLIRLRTRRDTLAKADPEDILAVMNANRAFNRSMWHASHNAPIEEVMDRLSNQVLARYPHSTLTAPNRLQRTIAEYGQLIDAIEEQDQETASRIAIEHMESSRNTRLQMWSSDSDARL